jgi:hypothetical protein
MLKGSKSNIFTDVKLPVKAGMQYQNGKVIDYKIKKVGYEIYRHYFDTEEKDFQVGSERIKRVIYPH